MTSRRRRKKAAGRRTGGTKKKVAKKKVAKKRVAKKTRKRSGSATTGKPKAKSAKRAKRAATRSAPGGSALRTLQPELEKALSRVLGRVRRKLDKLPRTAQLKLLELDKGGFRYTLNRLRPPPVDNLTGRQKEIARLVSHGLSNKEIGAKLRISPATVAAHLRTIFTKLRVRTRTALAKHALAYYG